MSQYRGIPESVIDEIKQRNEIVSVVEQYVRLEKKSAQNLFGLCPFHAEDTPSFSVSPGKQIFYCFGCHKGGNVINFIMEIEKIGYLDSIKLLAEKAKIEIPASDDYEYQKRAELQKKLYSANTEAARYFYKNLIGPQGAAAREYLKRRGIDSNTARQFGLGYAINEWEGLYQHLKSKGYPENIIFLTGLFKKRTNKAKDEQSKDTPEINPPDNMNDSGRGYYDLFRNRLMFPIFDYLKRIVAFGGRVMDDSLPKYINSPETPIYTKGRHLYGFHIAKSSRAGQLIIVEGYMDAIAMHQAGIDNAVASLGTALTEQQAVLIRKHSEKAIIAYDADLAGQAATIRGLELLTKKGCEVSILCLPEGKDPDEYIRRNGPERFAAILKDAMPLMDYKLWVAYNTAMKEGVLDRIKYQELACSILAQEENRIVRELYSKNIAEKLGVPVDTVISEVQRRISHKESDSSKKIVYPQHKTAAPEEPIEELLDQAQATQDELRLLSLLSFDPRIYPSIQPEPEIQFFSLGLMQFIAKSIFNLASEKKLTNSALMDVGADNVVNRQELKDLFACECTNIGEDIDVKKAMAEAQMLYIKIQIEKHSGEKKLLNRQIEELKDRILHNTYSKAQDEYVIYSNSIDEKKSALLVLDKKITELRKRKEQINASY